MVPLGRGETSTPVAPRAATTSRPRACGRCRSRCGACEDEREDNATRQRQRERGSRVSCDSSPGFD